MKNLFYLLILFIAFGAAKKVQSQVISSDIEGFFADRNGTILKYDQIIEPPEDFLAEEAKQLYQMHHGLFNTFEDYFATLIKRCEADDQECRTRYESKKATYLKNYNFTEEDWKNEIKVRSKSKPMGIVMRKLGTENIELQDFSCIGYAVHRAIRAIDPEFKSLSPMQIYNKARTISNANNKKRSKLTDVKSAFLIPDISEKYVYRTVVDEIVKKDRSGVYGEKNIDVIENFFKQLRRLNPEEGKSINLIVIMDTDVSATEERYSDYHELPEIIPIHYSHQGSDAILHSIILTDINFKKGKAYVLDSRMDLKLATSVELASRAVSKGSNDLMSVFGKEVLGFHEALSKGTSFKVNRYEVHLENFIEHFYMAFAVEKKQ